MSFKFTTKMLESPRLNLSSYDVSMNSKIKKIENIFKKFLNFLVAFISTVNTNSKQPTNYLLTISNFSSSFYTRQIL